MGNTNSNVTSRVKQQADTESREIYALMNFNGGGTLVNIMKQASREGDFSQVNEKMKELMLPFLYNDGEGKAISIAELVLRRNQDRPKHKQINQNKKHNEEDGSDDGFRGQISMWNVSDMDQSLMDVNGDMIYSQRDAGKYRFICCDIDQVGNVGESILHLCLLNATSLHAEIAKRLIKIFPKMINDIYLRDDYYGENLLHMAIVNEDPAMVKFLLDNGINFHERCLGSFMSPEDQKNSRSDTLDHEWIDVNLKTNYEGYVYWGEYPLSFAACLGQEECYRLILARGANPNNQDTNGNTTLHMLTIYQKIDMFNMVYELGAAINTKNYQHFTPLTLAAKLAKKDIFLHILKLQREIYWQLGNITCAAYPLTQVDTICSKTGEINKTSALNLVVYGDNVAHLDMMEGLIIHLLKAKWNKFVKFRPAPLQATHISTDPCHFDNLSSTTLTPLNFENITSTMPSRTIENSTESSEIDYCYLKKYCNHEDLVRFTFEGMTVFGALLYVLAALREAWFLGYQTFLENLMTVPSRALFLLSNSMIVVLMLPARFMCFSRFEDVVAVLVMLTTAPYFLFFCRGFKMVGPFVVMIYKMIVTDLLCFVIIYVVFVLGFSQAYYILFASHSGNGTNYFRDLGESITALFVMSLLKFDDIYAEFNNTDHPVVCKNLELFSIKLLLSTKTAMFMGQTVFETILSHWARIVLVVERGVTPAERMKQQKRYSQPTSDGDRVLVLRLQFNDKEKEEMTMLLEMNLIRQRNIRLMKNGSSSGISPYCSTSPRSSIAY
ncbi:Transient receptor potential cation channel subfamily V member 5 [Nymphon striatum]|nr:Transient receptor potential cation channel subfamily V member 5 [Nymphon striatum]